MTIRAALRLLAPLTALLVALLALTACGSESGDGGDADDPSGAPTSPTSPGVVTETFADPPAYEYPTGADDVVLDVNTAGGFTSAEYQFSLQPEVRVWGDGTVVMPGEVAPEAGYVPLLTGTLDEGQLQQLFAMADEAGLLEQGGDYDMAEGTLVTDLPGTSVLVHTDQAYDHDAYGLDYDETGDTPARQRLRDFVEQAKELAAAAATEPYEPDSVKLLVEVAGGAQPVGGDVAAWPADGPALADGTGCRLYDGPAVAEVVDALAAGGPNTVFRDGDATYDVTGAAVVPGSGRPCDP